MVVTPHRLVGGFSVWYTIRTMLNNTKIRYGIYSIGAIVIIFFLWQGIIMYQNRNQVVLREDLPLAPKSYSELKIDPNVAAEVSPEQQKKFTDLFNETVGKIKEHPDSFLAWMNIGIIKNLFGDYKGAEEAWLYATLISPDQNRSLMNLADLYMNKVKDVAKAEWAYRKSIENDPTFIAAYRDLAMLYRSIPEKKNQAIPLLLEGFEKNQREGTELLAIAAMWSEQDGNKAKAIEYYEKMLTIQPDNSVVKKDLERIKNLP